MNQHMNTRDLFWGLSAIARNISWGFFGEYLLGYVMWVLSASTIAGEPTVVRLVHDVAADVDLSQAFG